MRKRSIVTFAFFVAATSCSICMGQSGGSQAITNYSWRTHSPSSPALNSTTQTGNASAQFNEAGLRITPKPPTMTRQPFLASFRQENQESVLQDTQPSVSDQALDAPKTPDVSKRIPDAPAASAKDQPYVQLPALSIAEDATPETNYCDRDCRKGCNLGCEKKLFGTTSNGLEVGGWTSIGYHNRNNIQFNNRKAEGNLHQAWLYFDKPAEPNEGMGYHFDLLYGIDGQDTQAFGNAPTGAPTNWDNSWDYGSYGWALPQAYVQFANDCWDVKAGKFFSPFGYEVVASKENFFYSHNYTMYFTEPFTMSGVLGERKIRDNMSMILGVTAGWDTGFESNQNGFNLITGTRLQPNEFVDLALTTSLGDTGYRNSGTMTSGVAQFQLTDDVKYVFQADVLNLDTNQEFGIVQYLFREISPCLELGTRLEWWKSDQLFNDTKSTYEFTMGANYRPHANLVLRPELRFDWGAAALDPGTPIVGIDAVITF